MIMHKKARKQFTENKQTKDMDYWNDETKINLFGSDGVKRVWRQPGEENKDKCVWHSLLYIVANCHFLSVVTWKHIIKYLQKMWGVYSLLWDTVCVLNSIYVRHVGLMMQFSFIVPKFKSQPNI